MVPSVVIMVGPCQHCGATWGMAGQWGRYGHGGAMQTMPGITNIAWHCSPSIVGAPLVGARSENH